MFSADLLGASDRCPRAGYFSRDWEFSRLQPTEILRRSVDAGLMSEESDPGRFAGDTVMTYACDRGIEMEGSGVYDLALHLAALADILTTLLRGSGDPWARPADRTMETLTWTSSSFLDASHVRLHRVLIVDRISDERIMSEKKGWKTLGETSVYELPQTIHCLVIGQRRNGKHVGAFSQGYLHPRSRTLRISKKTGGGFSQAWTRCWREEQDQFSKEDWLMAMQQDGVLSEVSTEINVEPPSSKVLSEIRQLAVRKLAQIRETKQTPDPAISQCLWPVPCQFYDCRERVPGLRTGFVTAPK